MLSLFLLLGLDSPDEFHQHAIVDEIALPRQGLDLSGESMSAAYTHISKTARCGAPARLFSEGPAIFLSIGRSYTNRSISMQGGQIYFSKFGGFTYFMVI
jgi:hypothetical protein